MAEGMESGSAGVDFAKRKDKSDKPVPKKRPPPTRKSTWVHLGTHTAAQVVFVPIILVALGIVGHYQMQGQTATKTYTQDDDAISACLSSGQKATSPAPSGVSAHVNEMIRTQLSANADLSKVLQSVQHENQELYGSICAILQVLKSRGIEEQDLGSDLQQLLASVHEMMKADGRRNGALLMSPDTEVDQLLANTATSPAAQPAQEGASRSGDVEANKGASANKAD